MEPSESRRREVRLAPGHAFVRVFLAVFLLIVLGSAAITFSLPETYVSVARIKTPTGQAATFQSDAVLTRAAASLDLNRKLAAQYGESEPLDPDRTLKLIRRLLRVRTVPDTELTEVHVYSLKSTEAAELANAIAVAGTEQIRSGAGARAEVVDRAVPANRPVRPNKALNLVLGALVGALLGTFSGGVAARLALGFDRTPYETREP